MRDTPCGSQIFPLIITQTNCFQHSPSLQERGLGGEAFFYYAKREDVKSSFTSSLFTYILFLVPYCQLPSLRGRGLEKRLNCFTDQCRLDGYYTYPS